MALDFTQAIGQLASLVAGNYTLDDLLSLTQQVDVSASGDVTVLYSGSIGGVKTSDVAASVANNENIRIINKTAAARFLESDEFLSAVGGITLATTRWMVALASTRWRAAPGTTSTWWTT